MTAKRARILIADDHAVLRAGLKRILADEFRRAEFGEAASTPETIQKLHEQPWDLLLLDLNMPGRSGMEALREARQCYPRLPVLVLSCAPEDQLAVHVLKAGAAGFVSKQAALDELVNAVHKALAGEKYVSAATAQRLAAELTRPSAKNLRERLSNREFQVFEMMAAGKSLKEIAAELSLSVKTASTYRCRVFAKLRLKNDVELIRFAIQHGIEGD